MRVAHCTRLSFSAPIQPLVKRASEKVAQLLSPLLFSSHPVLNLNQADTTRVYVCANRCVGTTKLSRFVWENKSEVWESGRCWMGQGKQKEEEEEAPIPYQSQSLSFSPPTFFPCLHRSERRGGKTDPSPFSRPNIFPFSLSGKRRRTRETGKKGSKFFFFSQPGGEMTCLRKGGIASSSASAWVAFRRERCLCVTPTRRRPTYKQKGERTSSL